MRTLSCLCLIVSPLVITLSGMAAAQSVTKYDGTYNGISNTATSGRCIPPTSVPRPLTIQNGAAEFAYGLTGSVPFQGDVDAQGNLKMRNRGGGVVFVGTINASGKISGGSSASLCTIMYVWQKQ
jgi:hypothetical protein